MVIVDGVKGLPQKQSTAARAQPMAGHHGRSAPARLAAVLVHKAVPEAVRVVWGRCAVGWRQIL